MESNEKFRYDRENEAVVMACSISFNARYLQTVMSPCDECTFEFLLLVLMHGMCELRKFCRTGIILCVV